ncbi:27 kDa glycoprotein [Procambarus clarkii]|uniref:27 kDa glycoprotein n=1 Tax=Procambarus clarkii TaxID=6728 RepID=UPI001E674569|nr:27 kDa glycoprotein-like [Procambarus clarkii]
MGWKVPVCVVVMFALTGIVGQQLNLGDAANFAENIESPDDVPQIADWKERCRATVGEDAVNDIEESGSNLGDCVGRQINWSKLQVEINRSIPRGELDLVFKKYCGRRDRLMACAEALFTKLERCMNERELRDLNITRKAIDAGIDFICHNDGDKIALFMAEEGEECINSQKDKIQSCIEEKVPDLEETQSDPLSIGINDLVINEENCKKVNAMHQCVVKYTEQCEDPTPSNILDSLIMQILKVTPCWQTSSAPTFMSPTQYLLPHLLTLLAAALTAANILL